jgi:hypothetical protein
VACAALARRRAAGPSGSPELADGAFSAGRCPAPRTWRAGSPSQREGEGHSDVDPIRRDRPPRTSPSG